MKILINAQPLTLNEPTTVTGLLEQQGYNGKLVAVAINNNFLPKSEYAQTHLKDNDKIDIVAPMQGG